MMLTAANPTLTFPYTRQKNGNGTRRLKAKVMYAGVRLGGPRWSFNERPFNDLSSVSDTVIRQEMEYCKQWIEAQEESLSLEAIDQWMDEREAEILK